VSHVAKIQRLDWRAKSVQRGEYPTAGSEGWSAPRGENLRARSAPRGGHPTALSESRSTPRGKNPTNGS
jgi:hypothetical protein